MEYYFVGNALSPLAIGTKPELSFKEFYDLLRMNLTAKDMEKVEDLLWSIDLANIRAFWQGLPLDERSRFSPKELEEALLVREGLPEYLNDYLDRYDSTEERIRNFPALYAAYYQLEVSRMEGFLQRYFTMEREVRLILTALRAKTARRDVVRELQFEDPTDQLVADILAQKDAADYSPYPEYEDLKSLYQSHHSDPKAMHRALLEYRFQKVEEMEENEHFSLEYILGYMIRLMIVESWQALNEPQGRAITEELSRHG